jgi:hypothetical protein
MLDRLWPAEIDRYLADMQANDRARAKAAKQ